MLCTRCSEVVTPIVALDINGTLGDYHSHFQQFAEQWLGYECDPGVSKYDGSERYRQWFRRAFDVGEEVFNQVKLAYRQGGLKRTMPVFCHASELTQTIRKQGAEVWLVTTRPYLKHDAIDPDTREWLSRNSIFWDHLLYGPFKYQRLCDQVDPERVAVVMDDDVKQLREAMELGWHAILRRNWYNEAIRYPYSARSLPQAISLIAMELQAWKREHGMVEVTS